ncbi:MAG: lipoate--protein ligase [Clostridiales Family XIII bacterium]|jgi:lipoate-protein ligase A|nr:lipoate--protein ligase [Clostridiales Family XIII bacterium]
MLFIESKELDAAFHFAMEEYLIESELMQESPLLMVWRAKDTVMLGKNQLANAEVNFDFAKTNNIKIVRRNSGGGTIYVDEGTVQFTIIIPFSTETDLRKILRKTLGGTVIKAIKSFGIDAKVEGKNDILIDGKKISGLAQFVYKNAVCSHCSILYDVNIRNLVEVLNVSKEKLSTKGIASVRARIANLNNYINEKLDKNKFFEKFKHEILENEKKISIKSMGQKEINKIRKRAEEKFNNKNWTFGKNPAFTFKNNLQYKTGEVEIFLNVRKDNIIKDAIFFGDFIGDADEISMALKGRLFNKNTIKSLKKVFYKSGIFHEIPFEKILELFDF